jgi:hypothetical protein
MSLDLTEAFIEQMQEKRLDAYIDEGRFLIRQQIATIRDARAQGVQVNTAESFLPALIVTVSALRLQRRKRLINAGEAAPRRPTTPQL